MRRRPLNELQVRALQDILVAGGTERIWKRNPKIAHDYSWQIAGAPRTQMVHFLYQAGCLEPDRGDPHRMVVSSHGRAKLAEAIRREAA